MKNFLILNVLILALLAVKTSGQELNRTSYSERKNSIVFSPFNLIDLINPSLQIGYQRMLNEKWELQFEGGHIINKSLIHYLINPNEDKDDFTNRGHKIRSEVKRYFQYDGILNFYYSAEIYYMRNISEVLNQFIVSDATYDYSFELPDDGRNYGYTDYFTNDKTKHGLNIKLGLKVTSDAFIVETYLGAGIAYRRNEHSKRENINDKPYDTSILNDNFPGVKYLFNLPLNLKIGYAF